MRAGSRRRSKRITAARAARVLELVTASGAVGQARWDLADGFLDDLRRIDAQMREVKKRLTAAVQARSASYSDKLDTLTGDHSTL